MLKKLLKTIRGDSQADCAAPVIGDVLRHSLTYLEIEALNDLHFECRRLEQEGIQGSFIEAGCALGGSAIVVAMAKAPTRPLLVYDVFDMIPPPSERDGNDVRARYRTILGGKAEGLGGQQYYGYQSDLLEKVRDNFSLCGVDPAFHRVELIKGLFEDTMQVTSPVAFAHIDGDWYDSVTTCLERLVPNLSAGGTMVIDDYYHWSGCRRAVDDYFALRKRDFRFLDRSRLHIRRT